jgi:hypothetical protein
VSPPQDPADDGERLTLLALADAARDGASAPTVSHLAATTRLHPLVVRHSLRSLEAGGRIARAGLRNGGPAYTIVGP